MTDKEFVEGLKKGDENIFRAFVEQQQHRLLRLCMGFVHNQEDAKDLVQDVFIEVIRSVSGFREDSGLSTWLYRIAVNKSLNYLRKSKRIFKNLIQINASNIDADIEYASVSDIPDKSIETRQRENLIRSAIDTLQKNQRIAFILNKYENLSYKDISEIMNVSLSSVESLIHRAKVNLQKKLYNSYRKNLL